MNQSIKILAILLGAQLLLLLLLQFTGGSSEPTGAALLASAPADIDELTIVDGEGSEVTLRRSADDADDWQTAAGLPVDDAKLSGLLTKLTSIETGWPVATSSDVFERFEVADDKFQRQLTLSGDGVDTQLRFGTSPGYQQVHVRGAGDDVYAVKLSNFEMPASADDWLDKGLLFATGEPKSITFGGFALAGGEDGWLVNGQPTAADKAATVVRSVKELRVLGAGGEASGEATTIRVVDEAGEYTLELYKAEDATEHTVISSRYPETPFRVAAYAAEQLTPTLDDLLPPVTAEATEDAAAVVPDPSDLAEPSEPRDTQ